jgi:hypothetical protein
VSAASAATRATPQGQGRLPTLAVSLLAIGSAIAGLVLGGVYRSAPAPRVETRAAPIASAGVRVQLPTGWARGSATTLSGFDQPLWLRHAGAGVNAAVELLPAAAPTLLPVGVQASGAPQTVELASGRQAWRYRVERSDGVPLVFYAAPTTKGIATVGCLNVSGSTAERACRAVAVAVTVPGSHRLAPGERAAFLSRLPATVASLDSARTKGARALDAASLPAAQALAADGLARAHRAAAAELAPLRSNDDRLASETVGALGATASAYSVLADAARARSSRLYAEASRGVAGADGRLRRTMTEASTALDAANDRAAATPKPPVARSTPGARPVTPAVKKPVAVSAPKGSTLPLFLLIAGGGGFLLAFALDRLAPRIGGRRP